MHACSQSSGFKTMHLICIARFIKLLVLVKLIFYSQSTEKKTTGLHLDCFQSLKFNCYHWATWHPNKNKEGKVGACLSAKGLVDNGSRRRCQTTKMNWRINPSPKRPSCRTKSNLKLFEVIVNCFLYTVTIMPIFIRKQFTRWIETCIYVRDFHYLI